ncbi:MAG: formyltransferase [Burkholderiales bacterium]|nr:formyltransferase [Burkholderiales bacterium]
MKAVVFAYSNVGDRCLRVLRARGVEVGLVVTHRDRAGETLWFERVADTAAELGLDLLFADDIGESELRTRVAAAAPDLLFSFYYRQVLPQAVLDLAPLGAFNLHGSLLPDYRGRAPTNWAVLHGAAETGATLHFMVARPDAGEIVDQQAVPILPDDSARQVFDKVSVAAEIVLWRSLQAILAGTAPRRPNDIARGRCFGARKPEDGRIDWSRPTAEVYNLIRAVAPPYPGAFTEVAGVRLVIAKARPALPRQRQALDPFSPGLHVCRGLIFGVCGDGGQLLVHELTAKSGPVHADSLAALLSATTCPT